MLSAFQCLHGASALVNDARALNICSRLPGCWIAIRKSLTDSRALADLYDDLRRPADADQARKRLTLIREGQSQAC